MGQPWPRLLLQDSGYAETPDVTQVVSVKILWFLMPVPSSTASLGHTRRSWRALLSSQVKMQKAMFTAALSCLRKTP